jgi:formate transporter
MSDATPPDPTAGPADARHPREIARSAETLGVAKARADRLTLLVLGVLAGAFISLGAMLHVVVVTNSALGFGVTRLLGGIGFSLGLVLVVAAGAELFTGNNLLAMAWASGLIRTRDVLRNWVIVYAGNVIGCIATGAFVYWAGLAELGGGAVGATIVDIARTKCDLPLGEAFARGVLCNALVCLAVWLTLGGRSMSDKILAAIFPVAGFVALGLEHSIANWFMLPFALVLDESGGVSASGAIANIITVTAGNIVGGTLLVAAVYWVAYLRPERRAKR